MSPHFDLLSAQLKRGLRGGEGLPIGVQVIGKRWQEEMVMHAMQELEKSRDENGKFDKNIDF
jgi:Asp-tRNA(Asn)/Glu-tRNA(Gln) amidotransferase A subunit family amidase